MASSQESRSTQSQLQGEIFNKLTVLLNYEEQHIWEHKHTIQYPEQVKGHGQNNFYENNPTPIGGSFKAALVYKFALMGGPQYWVFAWYSPAPEPDSTNKVFTKLVYNKNDINWDEIENELDHSTNKSTDRQGQAMVLFTAPKDGISNFNATIEFFPGP